MTDLHIIGDLLAARLVWLILAELIVRPLLRMVYRRADAALDDRLPDLP